MPQTTYGINIAPAKAGQQYDIGPNDIISVNHQLACAVGVLLVRDSANGDFFGKVPGAATDVTNGGSVLGIILADQTLEQPYPQGNAVPMSPAKYTSPVIRSGRVWVNVEGAVTAGNQPYARYAVGTGSVLGAFRADADTSSAALVPNARFVTSTTGAGLAVVEVDFT